MSFPGVGHNSVHSQLTGRRFSAAHGLGGFSPWLAAPREEHHGKSAVEDIAEFMETAKQSRKSTGSDRGRILSPRACLRGQ